MKLLKVAYLDLMPSISDWRIRLIHHSPDFCIPSSSDKMNHSIKFLSLLFVWLCYIVLVSFSRLTDLVLLISQLPSEASSSQQQQAPAAFKNFSMSQKDKTLDELVRDKWLCRTSEGNIGLGIRSLLDLRSWFRNNDVPSCEVCNEAGVKVCLLKKIYRIHIVI